MTRASPILNFPDPTLPGVIKRLRDTSGRLTALNTVPHLRVTAGQNVPAGGTVTIEGTHCVIQAGDAGLNQMRLVVRGKTAAAGPVTLQLYDVTSSTTLATAQVTTSLATQIGAWVRVPVWNVDHELAIRVVGDAANAQTLYSVESQYRTATPVK